MRGGRGRRRGLFITLEGIEGSGKTSQAARLAKRLREDNYRVVETREPGGTPLAEELRRLLLTCSPSQGRHERLTPASEALLILASRSQHVAEVIEPALQDGAVVLCDRFLDSTLAYQGYGRGLDLHVLRAMNALATGGLTPDLTLLFDVPVPIGLSRRRKQERHHGVERNRIDRETSRFHARVRNGFLMLAAEDPGRIRVVDGRPDPDLIATQVAGLVHRFLSVRTRKSAGRRSRSRTLLDR